MSRITYQTDQWGSKKDDHIEVEVSGVRFCITVEDDKIVIGSDGFLDAVKTSGNVVTVTLDKMIHPVK